MRSILLDSRTTANLKKIENDLSQLNRLGVAYFLLCLLPISATYLHRLCFLYKSVGAKLLLNFLLIAQVLAKS